MSTTRRSRLERLFGAQGPLLRHWPGFIPRPQQIALAETITNALADGRPALCEAGTGVGKTLAYLVPLVHYLKRGGRAVVSTHTLALQAQLVERDIPNLCAAFPELDIRPAVLKGRSNYLCLQDLDIATGELWTVGDAQFTQIRRWARESETGDVAELDFSYPYWSDIAANQDTCRGRECRFFDRCFYYRARREAEDANLLVVNHALYFTDLRLRREMPGMSHLIPEHTMVVFDEAHHVEDAATRAFGLEWGSRRVPTLLGRARRVPGIERGTLDAIETLNAGLLAPFAGTDRQEAFMEEALISDSDRQAFGQTRDELAASLRALSRELTRAADNADAPSDRDRAQGLARLASRTALELRTVTRAEKGMEEKESDAADETPYFRWYQTRKSRNGQVFSTLIRTPLEIGKYLRETLLKTTPRCIFVSATLSTGGGFDYLKQRLGMNESAVEPYETCQGSPFDFRSNCLLYVPRTLGLPVGGFRQGGSDATDDYHRRLLDEVERLIRAARGRTFVLFTSHRVLRLAEERLRESCPYPLFVQGEMPNGRLVEGFIDAGNGVLLGTNSFWEGVDVSGPALSCVVIDKLPFPTPDTPLQRAREQAIKERGGDTFREWSLPQTQIRLKQGFGRLLRTVTDRGVVAILDERLRTKGYGRGLLNELPPAPRTDDFAEVEAFFAVAERAESVSTSEPAGN
ncbi:MAG: ATP-dependent DNA helicase [Capsulimonadales bacterium]|nr:ATP-dependent DNA helicase [Capsulimonadales bacterium]